MGFATVEDIQGSIGLVIFPRTWAETHDLLVEDEVVLVRGKVDTEGMDAKVLVDEIRKLEIDPNAKENDVAAIHDPAAGEWEIHPQDIPGDGIDLGYDGFLDDTPPDILFHSSQSGNSQTMN
jgi:DNA polymerase-3 subunit alpha